MKSWTTSSTSTCCSFLEERDQHLITQHTALIRVVHPPAIFLTPPSLQNSVYTPQIVGNESLCRELAYTGRTFGAEEAARMGLVSRALGPKSGREEAVHAAVLVATDIARHSPVAVFGTKRNLLYGRDHSVEDGLEYAATWNGAALQAEDLGIAMRAGRAGLLKNGGVPPRFSKL